MLLYKKFNSCKRDYIGYTTRPLNVGERVIKSSILSKAHKSFDCLDFIEKKCFTCICQGSNIFDLKVKEGFFINKCKPSLNTKYESIKQNSASWLILQFKLKPVSRQNSASWFIKFNYCNVLCIFRAMCSDHVVCDT